MNLATLFGFFAAAMLGGIVMTNSTMQGVSPEVVKTKEKPSLTGVIPPRPIGIYENPREFIPAGVRARLASTFSVVSRTATTVLME